MIPLLIGLTTAAPLPLPEVDADGFDPAPGADWALTLPSARRPEAAGLSIFGALAHQPLIWISPEGQRHALVDQQLALHLAMWRAAGPLRLSAAAPLYPLITGELHRPPTMGLGDLRLGLDAPLLDPTESPAGALIGLRATVPLGTEQAQVGGAGWGGALLGGLERHQGAWRLGAAAELELRQAEDRPEGRFGNHLDYSLAVGWAALPQAGLRAELYGELPFSLQNPVATPPSGELLGGGWWRQGPNQLELMGGAAVFAGVGSPLWRVSAGLRRELELRAD